jgi:hypothetical protein
MNDQLSTAVRRPKPRCRRCGRFRGVIYTSLCQDCVEQILRNYLPRLKQILEARYGRQLDKWFANGIFTSVQWDIGKNLTVSNRLFRCFLENLLAEAAENKDIWIEFDGKGRWTPTQFSQLVSDIDHRYGYQFRQLIMKQIVEAIRSSPTEQAVRELVALVRGKLEEQQIEVRDEALYFLAHARGPELPYGARVLMKLRYDFKEYLSMYTEVIDGCVDPVWMEMADHLPRSVQKLLREVDDFD